MKVFFKLILVIFIFISCQKSESEVELDKEIRFPLNLTTWMSGGGIGNLWGDTLWSKPDETISLKGFNKSNYSGIKTIFISVPMASTKSSTKCYVDLYNLTDSIPIEGSLIETNSVKILFVNSQNLLNSIPNKTVDLALRIKSSKNVKDSYNVGVANNASLILRR